MPCNPLVERRGKKVRVVGFVCSPPKDMKAVKREDKWVMRNAGRGRAVIKLTGDELHMLKFLFEENELRSKMEHYVKLRKKLLGAACPSCEGNGAWIGYMGEHVVRCGDCNGTGIRKGKKK